MSEKGLALMESLPPYYEEDAATKTVEDVVGRELQRVEDAATALQKQAFPQYADDTYRLLGLWETLLELPVEQPGATVDMRRSKVLSLLRKRRSGYGYDWVARMSDALGTTQWTYQEGPGNFEVAISIPYASGSFDATQVAAIARRMTPANLIVTVLYIPTFKVGTSTLGTIL